MKYLFLFIIFVRVSGQPMPPIVTETNSTDLLMLAWNPVTNVPVNTYTLARRLTNSASFSNMVTTMTTNVSILFPTAQTEYAVKANGTNGVSSVWSDSVFFTPLPPVTNFTYLHARFSTNYPLNVLTAGSLWTNFQPVTIINTGNGIGTNKSGWWWLVASNWAK